MCFIPTFKIHKITWPLKSASQHLKDIPPILIKLPYFKSNYSKGASLSTKLSLLGIYQFKHTLEDLLDSVYTSLNYPCDAGLFKRKYWKILVIWLLVLQDILHLMELVSAFVTMFLYLFIIYFVSIYSDTTKFSLPFCRTFGLFFFFAFT